jgi:purine catabolism regulator
VTELREPTHPRTTTGALTVAALLDHEAMRGSRVVAGTGGIDHVVARLNVMTVPDIVRWTKVDEFLLTTGYPLPRSDDEFCKLVSQLAERGLSGLGIKQDEYLAKVPSSVLETANRLDFPIVIIPSSSALDDVLSQAFATIVNHQSTALAKSREIHDTFLSIALSGGGLTTLVTELSQLLAGAAVVITDTNGRLLAGTDDLTAFAAAGIWDGADGFDSAKLVDGPSSGDPSETRWVSWMIRAGAMQHGFVAAAEGAEPFPVVAATAVEQAALVAALEITKDLAVASVERQFASNALHDLVTSAPGSAADAAARAASFGWNLQRPLTVLVAREEPDGEPRQPSSRARDLATVRAIGLWMSAVRARDGQAAAAGFATELVAIVSDSAVEGFARAVQADMTAASRRTYSIGVSTCSESTSDVPRLYQEARTALRVGRRLSGAGVVTGFAGLGLYRLISSVGEGELRAFLDDVLGPVLALPANSRADLLQTLYALSDNRYNLAETARGLHYHYNTVRYRVGKLEKLLGHFVDDAEASLHIGVALQILRMYEISGETHPPTP